jgi:hypothetical protein
MIQYISQIPSPGTLLRMVDIFIWISAMSENLWAFKEGTAKCRTGPTTWNKAESNFVIVLLLVNNSHAMPWVGALLWCKIQVSGQRWGLLRRTDSRKLANITLQLCSRNKNWAVSLWYKQVSVFFTCARDMRAFSISAILMFLWHQHHKPLLTSTAFHPHFCLTSHKTWC